MIVCLFVKHQILNHNKLMSTTKNKNINNQTILRAIIRWYGNAGYEFIKNIRKNNFIDESLLYEKSKEFLKSGGWNNKSDCLVFAEYFSYTYFIDLIRKNYETNHKQYIFVSAFDGKIVPNSFMSFMKLSLTDFKNTSKFITYHDKDKKYRQNLLILFDKNVKYFDTDNLKSELSDNYGDKHEVIIETNNLNRSKYVILTNDVIVDYKLKYMELVENNKFLPTLQIINNHQLTKLIN